MAFNALFPSIAAEGGEVRYDLLRNYYSEYTCNKYLAKILLDRSISNTMPTKRFSVGTKKGNLGVVALGIEWVACFYSSIVLPVRADSSAAKTIFRLLIASVMCCDRSTFSVIALCR